jgi:hypothetical protein
MQQIMTAQEIYANFHDGEGPDGLVRAGMHLQIVQAKYGEREQQIKELSASMEECWTGDASGAAQRGAGPLAVEHAGAAQQMNTAASLLTDQSTAWIDTKNKVQPVPPVPEEPSTLKQIITMGSAKLGLREPGPGQPRRRAGQRRRDVGLDLDVQPQRHDHAEHLRPDRPGCAEHQHGPARETAIGPRVRRRNR